MVYCPIDQLVDRLTLTQKVLGSNPSRASKFTAPSSNGRTTDFDSVYVGSIPAGASILTTTWSIHYD